MSSQVVNPPPASGRTYTAEGRSMGRNSTYKADSAATKGEGSLANSLSPKTPKQGMINVVADYDWTASPIKKRHEDKLEEVPYIRLIEFKCNETMIKRQIDFYSKLTPQLLNSSSNTGKTDILGVYKEIFPKDEPTDYSYWFPYFNKTGFQLSTGEWQQLDPIGDALKSIASGAQDIANSIPGGGIVADVIGALQKGGEFAVNAAQANLAKEYPLIGVVDRPRVFSGHSNRQINISFPLYNTLSPTAWTKNRDLIYLLMSQNLFNKRDYITGVPPVFYEVYVPGQYFCYAASMTDINVEYLGNTRLLYKEYIVPDAYQVTLTLSEMVMPSKNQFEAIVNGQARKFTSTTFR